MLKFLAYMLKIIFDLEDDLNHQSNRKKTFFAQNPTKNSYSPLLDLEIDILTLKMTFYHQNSIKNRLFSKKSHQKDVLHFFPFCFEKIIFLHFDLGNDLSTLKMTMDQQNNTINGFFRQNYIKKGITHVPSFIC